MDILVGLSERVRPALIHAFRTSIEASLALEVRFDKMHAYIADMEAARLKTPPDIEWPELDGHHGIPVLNVPLGSPGYAVAVREAWGRLYAATASRHLNHADARVMEPEAEPESGSQKEMTAFLYQANNFRF
eukprot:jgi/Tetstr1/422943/TSEL_013722.t1